MSNKNNEESLYVLVNTPDTRKRFTIFYEKNENEKESIVLIVPITLTFSGFLGLLINKFKLTTSDRSHIRVRTTNDNGNRRIKSLDNTYNNQILIVTISPISDIDPDDVEEKKQLTTSQEYQEKLKKLESNDQYLQLFKNASDNKNKFYNCVINKLLSLKKRVLIGESYPYRCKILISDDNKDSRIWLYLIEKPSTNNDELDYSFDIIIELNQNNYENIGVKKRQIDLLEIIKTQYEKDKIDIVAIVTLVEEYYETSMIGRCGSSVLDSSVNLFIDHQLLRSDTSNKLLGEIYQRCENVSDHFNVPYSISRKLLFKNSWDVKSVTSLEKYSVRTNSYPHKSIDIQLYKFKNSQIIPPDQSSSEQQEKECPICYCEYSNKEMIELICGHSYCIDCMTHYFNTSINDGSGGSVSIGCPTNDCLNKSIDEVTIETLSIDLLKSTGISQNLIRDISYNSNNTINICQHDGCTRVVISHLTRKSLAFKYSPYISCNGHTICLFCKKNALHWPVPCNKPVHNESDLFSYRWIVENTTICGRCKFPVEKTYGCNHMTCSRCRYQFCYSCGKDYTAHGTCQGSMIDENRKNKSNIFFEILANNKNTIDSSFIKEFFEGKFQSSDPIISHIFKSLISIITERTYTNKRHYNLLQNAVFFLHAYNSGKLGVIEKANALESCQKSLKKLLTQSFYNHQQKPLMFGGNNNDAVRNIPPTRSLSVTVCKNGSKKQLFKLFVNSKFNEFKEEIANQLNKILIPVDSDLVEYDPKKIRIYNLYGGQIKATNEIIDNEPIFVTSSIHEPWIEPQFPTLSEEEIEQVRLQIETEEQQQVKVGKNTFTTLKPKKEKTSTHVSKLKEAMEKQLKLQEDLKNDQTITNLFNYRNSLISDDDDDDDNDNEDFEKYNSDKEGEEENNNDKNDNSVKNKPITLSDYDDYYDDDNYDEVYNDDDYDEDGDNEEDLIHDQILKKNKGKDFW
ncbi:hypothetical protein RB653_009576 [Dictyostelium firmibasis]|uniref:RBR-type E3 ubiquitin transferase n=1 Tax=Dictyostelium firmibasis TaxID=79012 RepID=A0AAN7UEK3_9MYCE